MIIGRIGCLSMGIYEPTYGNETDFFLVIDLGDGKLCHPTALDEITFLLQIGIMLFILKNNYVLQSGRLFQLFMIAYLCYRLLINFIQSAYETPIFGLSVLQLTALLGLLYYAVILVP